MLIHACNDPPGQPPGLGEGWGLGGGDTLETSTATTKPSYDEAKNVDPPCSACEQQWTRVREGHPIVTTKSQKKSDVLRKKSTPKVLFKLPHVSFILICIPSPNASILLYSIVRMQTNTRQRRLASTWALSERCFCSRLTNRAAPVKVQFGLLAAKCPNTDPLLSSRTWIVPSLSP